MFLCSSRSGAGLFYRLGLNYVSQSKKGLAGAKLSPIGNIECRLMVILKLPYALIQYILVL